MKWTSKAVTAILLILCVVIFGIFFGMIYCGEQAQITEHHETCRSYEKMENYSFTQWDDPQAPAGIRQEYRWYCPEEEYDGASLAFYLTHQGVQVYYADEMVYSLQSSPDNSLTHSPGSHWVMIPLHDFVHGNDVRIVITPYYYDIAEKEVDIMIGSLYYIFLNIFRENLMYVMLSVLALIMGIGMLTICVVGMLMRKKPDAIAGYTGITVLFIGIWRITDTKLSAFLFRGNVLALDYITVGMLFLICIPFGLATRRNLRKYMYPMAIGCALVCLGVMAGHLLGRWDIRDMLTAAHGMIILNALVLLVSEIVLLIRMPTRKELAAMLLSVLPIIGALADIANFYIKGSSADIFYVIVGFLIYGLGSFAQSWQEAARRVYIDVQTGLYNRARWEKTMNEASANGCGIILFDMNGLKRVNDRLGHEAGDIVICSFADILRSSVTAGQVLCRWGGDEFAIYVPKADARRLQNILKKIRDAVDRHNASAGEMKVQYAAGYAAAADHPGMSCRDLFRLADEKMYMDKNR